MNDIARARRRCGSLAQIVLHQIGDIQPRQVEVGARAHGGPEPRLEVVKTKRFASFCGIGIVKQRDRDLRSGEVPAAAFRRLQCAGERGDGVGEVLGFGRAGLRQLLAEQPDMCPASTRDRPGTS